MNRAQMIFALPDIIEAAKSKSEAPVLFVPKIADFNDDEKATDEYEALGYFVTSNPLEKYKLKLDTLTNIGQETFEDKQFIKCGGLLTDFKPITTKAGKQMGFFMLEDLTGRIEVVAFPAMFGKNKELFEKNKPIEVSGRIEVQTRDINGEEKSHYKIILMKIKSLVEGKKLEKIILYPKENDDFVKIRDIITANPGGVPLEVEYNNAVLKTRYTIQQSVEVLNELESSCLTRRIYG